MGKLVADQPSQTCGFSQGRVLDQEFRKLSQTSLEIIHTISDININWHWQDRNTIDCLAYWVSITTDFKKRLWMCSCGDEPHFWRKYFSLEQRKCCLAEQNANSISVLRLDFLMCGEGRRVKLSQGDTESWHSPGQRDPGSGETEQPRDKGIQTLLPLSNSRFHSKPKLGVSRFFFILVSLIRVIYCSSKNKRNYPWREERWWLLISNQVLIKVVDSGRVKKHVFW